MASFPLIREERTESVSAFQPGSISICLIGGIYGKNADYRSKVKATPETILESGFKEHGHQVVTLGHCEPILVGGVDVIHVHHSGPACLRSALSASGAAIVYTSHDGPAMAGLRTSFSHSLAGRFIMSRADAVVALTDVEAEFQRATYPIQGATHAIIPNGIDTRIFGYARRNRAGQGGCPWKLLYVGQLIPGKHVNVLLRALTHVSNPVELDLVFHTDALRGQLEQLVRALNLTGRVRFLGAKTSEELRDCYQSADILVLPSAAEALPSVVTEAMICGTPVVATDVGGVRNQLAGYGRLVGPGEVTALAEAIRSVIDNYHWFAAQGEAMSRYAQQRFSIDAMVESHLELYRSLLQKKEPRRRKRLSQVPLNAAARLGVRLLCKT